MSTYGTPWEYEDNVGGLGGESGWGELPGVFQAECLDCPYRFDARHAKDDSCPRCGSGFDTRPDPAEEYIAVRADEIKDGDLVDLEGDDYADPKRDHPAFDSELYEVGHIERETPECVAIGFEGFDVIGFPVGHLLAVRRGSTESEAPEGSPEWHDSFGGSDE